MFTDFYGNSRMFPKSHILQLFEGILADGKIPLSFGILFPSKGKQRLNGMMAISELSKQSGRIFQETRKGDSQLLAEKMQVHIRVTPVSGGAQEASQRPHRAHGSGMWFTLLEVKRGYSGDLTSYSLRIKLLLASSST